MAVPSVSATAVPVPGATRLAIRETSHSRPTAGRSTPSRPSAHVIGAVSVIAARAWIARARL